MLGIIHFGTFLITGILLNLTPGTDTMYVLGKSLSGGKQLGYLSALGIGTGSLVHTLFAGFGLSIVLKESQIAFNIVKYLGAVYLAYLGVKLIMKAKNEKFDLTAVETQDKYFKTYISGVFTNILNPKVALFYLAFLPQFIDSNYEYNFLSFIVLGVIFTMTGTIWCLILAKFSSKFSQKIKTNIKIKKSVDRLTGFIFILIGIKLALGKLK